MTSKRAQASAPASPGTRRRIALRVAVTMLGGLCGLAVAYGLLAPCATEKETAGENISLLIGNKEFIIEIARTPAEQRQGLSGRRELADNGGMIFVYSDEAIRTFWMNNTWVPLSIAFIASDGTIREIHDLIPHNTEHLKSLQPARYALELPRGAFEAAGVRPGDKIGFPPGWLTEP